MAYLGNSPVLSQQEYRNIDNISGSFNGVTTSFALLVNGVAPVPAPQSSNQCLISVNGVVQKPDDTGATGFRLSGGNIIFSSAPTGGQSFFGVILAGADYIYAGQNFPDGTVSAPSITFAQDTDTGFFRSGAGEIKYTANGTAVVTLSSNNLTAPSFIPTSSSAPTNGVYLPAANSVGISTNSTERLRITSAGLVGIGTNSPLSPLDVAGTKNIGSDIGQIVARDTTAFATGVGGSILFAGKYRNTGDYVGTGYINTKKDNATDGNYAFSMGFGTIANGGTLSEKMTLTSGGSLGIGTTSVSDLLHIKADSSGGATRLRVENGFGASNTSSQVYFNCGGAQANIAGLIAGANENSGLALTFGVSASATTPTERMRLDQSGRLLVGTSTPIASDSSILQVAGGDSARPRFHRNINDEYESAIRLSKARGTGFQVVNNNDNVAVISFQGADGFALKECASISAFIDGTPGTNDMPGRLVFSTTADGASSPTERMRITSGGLLNLGGASTPNGVHTFNWQGANRTEFNNRDATAANCYGLVINYSNAAPNGVGNEFIYCQDNVGARFLARSNGGLANYSANNANLSDRNAKKDISLAAGTWDCIKEWEIVNYRYKDQPDDADLNLGVIAQQVAESCPEVITVFQEAKEATEDQPAQEERLGVKEQQMYWMAIKALQEAQVRIEALEAEVAALKAQ